VSEEASGGDAVRRIEQELIVLIRRVRRNTTRQAHAVDPDLHASGYSMLRSVLEHDALRSKDLADLLDVDKAVVSRQVAHLEDLGLVARTNDPDDGRAQLVALTDEGRHRLETVRSRERAEFARRLGDWPPSDLDRFADLLSRYNALFER
jgi:DNA-binding MarR family transcriptional regulator